MKANEQLLNHPEQGTYSFGGISFAFISILETWGEWNKFTV